MKMARSRTKRKSKSINKTEQPNFTISEIDVGIKQIVDVVGKWTSANFKSLQKDIKSPLCWVTNTSALVGNCKITEITKDCWRVENRDEFVHDFTNKKIALFYSIMFQSGNASLSDELLSCDRDIGRFEGNQMYYNRAMNRCIDNKDGVGSQIWGMRLDNATINLNHAKNKMKVLITKAKYYIVRRDFTK